MTDSVSEREEIIGLIYDAATDPTLWPPAIERLADHLHCVAGALLLYDAGGQPAQLLAQARINPVYLKLLVEKYLGHLPELNLAHTLPVGTVSATTILQPRESFRKSRFFHEWVRPQGYLDAFCAVMHRSGDRSAVLHLIRDERIGYVSAADIEQARSFAPHLVRAAKLGLQLEHLSRRRQERDKSLDRLGAAIILLDAAGRILFANQAAERMLRKQDGITTINRVLHAHDTVADRALHDVIARVSARDAAVRRAGDVVVPRADRRPLVLSVTPLSPRSGEGFAPRATAIVVANDPEQQSWSGIETVAQSYGLTAGEGRLLKAIVEGEGIDAAANQLGISRDTAKTHLQRIFQKTLTSRQGELIRLVTTSLPPLRR